jgi:hypothetical protein
MDPPAAHGEAALEQEGPQLIDYHRALANQPFGHAMDRLEIELRGRLQRHEPHRVALNRLDDRLRIEEVVVLVRLHERPHLLRPHEPHVVALSGELPPQMVRAARRLHADEARLEVHGEPQELQPRQLLPHYYLASSVDAHEVKDGLTEVDPDHAELHS